MKSKTAELCRLDPKVFKSLCLWINLLINELSLNIIGRQYWPPESLVEQAGGWFEDGLGNIDVTTLLDNFFVYQLGKFCCLVVLWTVQLVSLFGSAVILKHFLQCLTNIDGLESG